MQDPLCSPKLCCSCEVDHFINAGVYDDSKFEFVTRDRNHISSHGSGTLSPTILHDVHLMLVNVRYLV